MFAVPEPDKAVQTNSICCAQQHIAGPMLGQITPPSLQYTSDAAEPLHQQRHLLLLSAAHAWGLVCAAGQVVRMPLPPGIQKKVVCKIISGFP